MSAPSMSQRKVVSYILIAVVKSTGGGFRVGADSLMTGAGHTACVVDVCAEIVNDIGVTKSADRPAAMRNEAIAVRL